MTSLSPKLKYQLNDDFDIKVHNNVLPYEKTDFKPHFLDQPFYPSDYTLCKLSKLAYKDNVEDLPDGWTLLRTGNHKKDGYSGAIFWHHSNRQLVIAHRGTKGLTDGKAHKANLKGVIQNHYVPRAHSACAFAYHTLKELDLKYFSLSITGHSLGAWLAQITTFVIEYLTVEEESFCRLDENERKYHPHTVTFDSPGCYEMLCKISKDYFHRYENKAENLISALDITTYFIVPNFINAKNQHAGKLFCFDKRVKNVGSWSEDIHTFKYHKLDNFLGCFNKDPNVKFSVLNWPKFVISKKLQDELLGSEIDEYTFFHKLANESNNFQPNLENENKYCVTVHYKVERCDDKCTKVHIFKEEELIFLENLKKFQENQINTTGLNKFLEENNLGSLDLSNYEIFKGKIKSSDSDKLSKIISRTKKLFENFPEINEIMKLQISDTPLIFQAMYEQARDGYLENLPTYNINFKDIGLEKFLKDKNLRIMVLNTKNTKIEVFRSKKILENWMKRSIIFLSFKKLKYLEKYVDVAGVFESSSDIDEVLVIDFEDAENIELMNNLFEKSFKEVPKKIICVASTLNFQILKNMAIKNFRQIVAEDFTKTNSKKLSFNDIVDIQELQEPTLADLDATSLENLLSKKIISLNKRQLALNDFLKTNDLGALSSLISFDILEENFLKSKNIVKISYQNNHFKTVFLTSSCVKVCKKISFDTFKTLLTKSTHESLRDIKFFITGVDSEDSNFLDELEYEYEYQNLITLDSTVDQGKSSKLFYDFCSKYPKTVNYKLHWSNQDGLIWLEVFNPDLYIKRNFFSMNLKLTEEELMEKEERVLLISNEAGMGKSTALMNLAKNIQNVWIFWINLINAHEHLDDSPTDIDSVITFLLKFCNESSDLAKILLKFSLTNDSVPVFVFFDAFDEIQDVQNSDKIKIQNKILEIFQFLKEETLAKIFISTRPYDCQAVNKKLQVDDIRIKDITEEEQIEFCTKFWMSRLNFVTQIDSAVQEKLISKAKKIQNNMNKSIDEYVAFMGIPLQLKMITEIFQPDNIEDISYTDFNFNLYELYSKFEDKKYEIYFQEKMCFTPQAHKPILVNGFKNEHKNLGMKHLFPKSIEDIDYQFAAELNRIGLVQVNGLVIVFVHRTFAEYFATKLLVAWMKNQREDKIIIEILSKSQYVIIRRFINDMLTTTQSTDEILKFFPEFWGKLKNCIKCERIISGYAHSYCKYTIIHQTIKENNLKLFELILKNFERFGNLMKELINAKDEQLNTPVHFAVNHQKVPDFSLQLLKLKEANILANNRSFTNPIILAFECGNYNFLFQIIELKKNDDFFNRKFGTAMLCQAMQSNNLERALTLMDMEFTFKDTEAYHFFPYGRWNVVRMLTIIKINADPDMNDLEVTKQLLGLKDDIWNLILELNHVDINFKNAKKQTFLHFAIAEELFDIAENLIDNGADLNAVDSYQNTPAYIAAVHKHWNFVALHIKKKNIKRLGFSDHNFFNLALEQREMDIFWQMVELTSKIVEEQMENSPLSVAVQLGRLDLVPEIIKLHPSSVTISNEQKETVLHFACEDNKITTALELIKNGADVNLADISGETPLMRAAKYGNWILISEAIKLNASFVHVTDKRKRTILHLACVCDQLQLALECVKNGADVNLADKSGDTPLLLAAKSHNWILVSKLIATNASVDISDNCKRTLLHLACLDGKSDLALQLIDNGADVNTMDITGDTPLLLAASNHHWSLVAELIERNASVNISNVDNRTILYFACQDNQLTLALELINMGLDVNLSDLQGSTPLLQAAENHNWLLFSELVKIGTCDFSNESKINLLHLACRDQQLDPALLLIKLGITVKMGEDTPALIAAKNHHWALVSKLIESNASVNVPNYSNQTVLHFACQDGELEIALQLVQNGADVNIFDVYSNSSPLLKAAHDNHWPLVHKLMEVSDNISDRNNQELLKFACRDNQIDLVLRLVQSGADVNANFAGNTPLLWAAEKDHWDLVLELLKLSENISNKHKQYLLRLACRKNILDLALLLVQKGADLNLTDDFGKTPLHLAAEHNHSSLILELVKSGATISNLYTQILLQYACKADFIDLAKELVKKRADVNLANNHGDTPLLTAVHAANWDLASELIKLGAFVDVLDHSSKTPLHIASSPKNPSSNSKEFALLLVQKGADVNLADYNGNTPLILAASSNNWDLVPELIMLNASVTKFNEKNNTVLHYACQDGKTELALEIINKKADINFVNDDGNSPILLAACNHHWDLVKKLIDLNAVVTIANREKETVLHYAYRGYREDIVKKLINKGYDVNDLKKCVLSDSEVLNFVEKIADEENKKFRQSE